MIIGSGQLAKAFKYSDINENIIFASGVSNSNCNDKKEFEREKKLLLSILLKNKNKNFVYFSSCALSSDNYALNNYYKHKKEMEELIKKHSDNYYIFRIPQLFGQLKEHKTLINFIYYRILENHQFSLYNNAYRYVISIDDAVILVNEYIKYNISNTTIDLANPYHYKVIDIVEIFEKLLNKTAKYDIIIKNDKYLLDLTLQNEFIKTNNVDVKFSKNYLYDKLSFLLNNKKKTDNECAKQS